MLSTVDGAKLLVECGLRPLIRLNVDIYLVIIAGLIAWSSFFFGETIPIHGGLGWEGIDYWGWVKDLPFHLTEIGFDRYRVQRILPSAILYFSFRVLQIEPTISNTLCGFAALNILSISLIAHFWCLTANQLGISTRGKWLGIIGLLLNYAVLKFSGFYAAMTDMPAYASSAAMVYFYLSRQRLALWGVTAAAAFLWPTQLYIGTILSLFPRQEEGRRNDRVRIGQTEASEQTAGKGAPWHLNIVIAFFAAYYWCFWASYVCGRIQMPLFGGIFPIRSLLPLSLLISGVYVFFVLKPLLNDRRLFQLHFPPSVSTVAWSFGSLLLVVVVKYVQTQLSNRAGYFGFNNHLFVVGISAVAKPGLFLVAHFVYFGPFWLLAVVYWPTVCRLIHAQNGPGLTAAIAIGMCHALQAESRHFVYVVPLILPFVVQAIEPLEWTRGKLVFLTFLSIIASKCWLFMGGDFVDNVNVFPDQYFWMNIGTFMTDETYVWQLIGLIVCAVAMYNVLSSSIGRISLAMPAPQSPPTSIAMNGSSPTESDCVPSRRTA